MRSPDWRAALTVRCPACSAPRLELCTWAGGKRGREDVHARRLDEAHRIEREVAELRASLDRVAVVGRETLDNLIARAS